MAQYNVAKIFEPDTGIIEPRRIRIGKMSQRKKIQYTPDTGPNERTGEKYTIYKYTSEKQIPKCVYTFMSLSK